MVHDPFLVHHLLFRAADRFPLRTAIVADGVRFTYEELARAAHGFAAALQANGVVSGDRVITMLENGFQAVVAMFGALIAGAVAVPLSPQTRSSRLQFIVRDAEPAAIVLHGDRLEKVRDALVAFSGRCIIANPDSLDERLPPNVLNFDALTSTAPAAHLPSRIDADLAMLIYTSGSTGLPKAVMLSHLNMLSAARSIQAYLGYVADDIILCALPLSFDYGLYQQLLATTVGATVVFERSMKFPGHMLRVIESARITVLPGVPTLFSTLLRMTSLGATDCSPIRIVTNTGAAMTEQLIRELRKAFPKAQLFSMYGLTECKRVSYLPSDELDARPTSVGRGMPNQAIWLIDESGARLPPGSTGELVVSGNHVMLGYWRRPEETKRCLSLDPERRMGVLRTGDMFRTDSEGYLYFLGRTDDIIKCRGQKVSPREVENSISELAGVAEVAVVGCADDDGAETVKAFVVLKPGFTYGANEILSHCLDRLESYMMPTEVNVVSALPRTENGKVDKKALAARKHQHGAEQLLKG